MSRSRVVLELEVDHDGGAPVAALLFDLEGMTIYGRESVRPLGVIDSATMREAEVVA